MNTDLMFSSGNTEWETPSNLFDELNNEFHFTLDPCCSVRTAKCEKFYTLDNNGLLKDWSKDVVFVNPPYGRQIKKWIRKSYQEYLKGATVVMLIPARTDTTWFHEYIYNKSEVRFMKGRVKFLQDGVALNSAPFPTMIVVFR